MSLSLFFHIIFTETSTHTQPHPLKMSNLLLFIILLLTFLINKYGLYKFINFRMVTNWLPKSSITFRSDYTVQFTFGIFILDTFITLFNLNKYGYNEYTITH